MKKLFITWGLAAAALTLFSCAKQETIVNDAQPTQAGVPFELVAGVDTKTEATDAGVVTWKTGDALNVFHAAAGTTSYSNNDKFTFSSGSSFTGTLQDGELTENAYDWYALYPYYSGIETPSNTSKGYTTFAASQTQVGNNSMAHLCGENMPLYGKVTNVAKDAKPSITMNQAASIIKVQVTNTVEANLTVSSISVTAPEEIAGNYFINFAGESPSFTEANSSGKKTVTLTVKNGVAIAKNGYADFYIAVKPFSASSGEIVISVNGYHRAVTLNSETIFSEGKIKTINFSYQPQSFVSGTYELATAIASGDEIIFASGKTGAAKVLKQYNIEYNNYRATSANVISSKIYSTEEMGIFTVSKSGDDFTFFDGRRGTYLNATSTTGSNYLKESVSLDDYAKFTVGFDGDTPTVQCTGKASRNILKYNSGGDLFSCYSSGQDPVYIYKRVTGSIDPIINVTSETTIEVPREGTIPTINYSIINPVSGKSISADSNVNWINTFDYSVEGEVTFVVDAQSAGSAARSGNITLSYDGAVDVVVTVNQAAGETVGNLTINFEEASVTSYSDWSFSNMTTGNTNANVTAHGGSKFGTTGGKATASIATKSKIAAPKSITFYVSKQTTNTTSSTWYVQVSTDGTRWTNVKTQSATSMDRGTWVEVSQSLTSYSNVYVRIYYNGSTAVRCIDDVTLVR